MAVVLSGKRIKIIKIVVIVILILIVTVVAKNLTQIKTVEINEGEHYTYDEIKEYLMTGAFDHNSIYLYLKNRYGEQPDIPFVEYVDVELKDRNTISFTVYEKKIVGCMSYMSKYLYFDKDGYFVEQSDSKLDDVSYITGINANAITLYKKMDVADDDLFKEIMNITKLIEKYKIKTDSIDFSDSGEVTIYSDDIKILLGKQDTYDEQIAKLVSLLESAQGLKGTFHMENYDDNNDNIIFDKK